MKTYVVRSGDYLKKIAHAVGWQAEALWNDPSNAKLTAKRDPNQLLPGDVFHIPDTVTNTLVVSAGSTNRYVAEIPKTKVKLTFKNEKGSFAERTVHSRRSGRAGGRNDRWGGCCRSEVPVHCREVTVTFPDRKVVYPIRVGDMDPIDEPSGVRKRLEHLGYQSHTSDDALTGMEDGDVDEGLRKSVRRFQTAEGLNPTGELDDETKAKLLEKHGG